METMMQNDPVQDGLTSMDRNELIERREDLLRKVKTMQWDKSHNQLHAGKKRKLDAMEKELGHIADVLAKE